MTDFVTDRVRQAVDSTFVRDDATADEHEAAAQGRVKDALASASARAVAASALLVPLAAVVGGMNLGNHNEIFVRDEVEATTEDHDAAEQGV